MISAAEAKEASQAVDYTKVAAFLKIAETRVMRAASLGKNSACIYESTDEDLTQHFLAYSPTFSAFLDELKASGYVVKCGHGIMSHVDISW